MFQYKSISATVAKFGGSYVVCHKYSSSFAGGFVFIKAHNYTCTSHKAAIELIEMLKPDRVTNWDEIRQEHVSDCDVCESPPSIPSPVDGGSHKHYQICCNNCGIEVTNTDPRRCEETWNDLMVGADI